MAKIFDVLNFFDTIYLKRRKFWHNNKI